MAKQIMNVRDVMAVLEELAEKNYIVIPGKIPAAYFQERCYGMHAE